MPRFFKSYCWRHAGSGTSGARDFWETSAGFPEGLSELEALRQVNEWNRLSSRNVEHVYVYWLEG